MENTIKINTVTVKNTTTDNNLYNHTGISTDFADVRLADNRTVENFVDSVSKLIDTFNNLVEYDIEIENCTIKNFQIATTEDFTDNLCDLLDELETKYNCNFNYDCSLCCGCIF
jgi:hypothetical protein